MPRSRTYQSNAERQKAYRQRRLVVPTNGHIEMETKTPEHPVQREVLSLIDRDIDGLFNEAEAIPLRIEACMEISVHFLHLSPGEWNTLVGAMDKMFEERCRWLSSRNNGADYEAWLKAQWQALSERFGLWPGAYVALHGWLRTLSNKEMLPKELLKGDNVTPGREIVTLMNIS